MFCSVSEKRGMHEFTYFSIGGLPTKSRILLASAASQYSLRDLHVNIMLNPHAATEVRMSSYERPAGSNPKVRVADYTLANRKLRRAPWKLMSWTLSRSPCRSSRVAFPPKVLVSITSAPACRYSW
jgi:hypothetical protein